MWVDFRRLSAPLPPAALARSAGAVRRLMELVVDSAGRPLDSDWFSRVLGRRCDGVEPLRSSAIDTGQSSGLQLDLCFGPGQTQRVFLKTVVGARLPSKPLRGLLRDLDSNRNEAIFYQHFAPELLQRGVPSPRALHIEARTGGRTDEAVVRAENGYLFLLECVDGSQSSPLRHEAQQSLRSLAALHAATWEDRELLARAAAELHPRAGYWALEVRGRDELEQCERFWPAFVQSFGHLAPDWFAMPSTQELGARVRRQSEAAAAQLSPGPGDRFACLVHGDAKAMNMFFMAGDRPAVLIDFQWTSIGYGMSDVAMHLSHSVAAEALEGAGELELLRCYYDALVEGLPAERASDFTWEVAQRHYALAVVDYARIVFGHFFKDASLEAFEKRAANPNCGLPYKDLTASIGFVKRVDRCLQELGD